jgi:tetratricopeptide (TPR) repeat protein
MKPNLRKIFLLAGIAAVILGAVWLTPRVLALYYQIRGGRLLSLATESSIKLETGIYPCVDSKLDNQVDMDMIQQAIEFLNKAKQYNASLPHSYYLLGQAYCLSGDPINAEKTLIQYIEFKPHNPLGHIGLGFANERLNRTTVAISEWNEAQATEEDFIAVGQENQKRGKFTEATQWYERVALLGFSGDALFFKGTIFQENQRWEKALVTYKNALKEDNFSNIRVSDVYYRIGTLYQRALSIQDYEKALSNFDMAIELDVFSSKRIKSDSYYRRGEIYISTKQDPKAAVIEFQNALRIDPSHHWALLRLGYQQYWLTKNIDQAEKVINQAIRIWPDDSFKKWPHRDLGDIYLDAGLESKARVAYETALKLDPTDKEIVDILSKLAK